MKALHFFFGLFFTFAFCLSASAHIQNPMLVNLMKQMDFDARVIKKVTDDLHIKDLTGEAQKDAIRESNGRVSAAIIRTRSSLLIVQEILDTCHDPLQSLPPGTDELPAEAQAKILAEFESYLRQLQAKFTNLEVALLTLKSIKAEDRDVKSITPLTNDITAFSVEAHKKFKPNQD